MSNNFTPGYNGFSDLRFWCQKVLPQVYDESLSYSELLGKVVAYLNEIGNGLNVTNEYVKEQIENFNVSGEVSKQISEMYDDGRLQNLITAAVSPDILLVGDSFGEGFQPENTTRQGWIYYFKQYGQFSCNVYDTYKGGASFLRDDEYSFKYLIQQKAIALTEDQRNKIGSIIVIGGTNESMMSSNSDLENRIKEVAGMCKTAFPNAVLYLGFTANIISPGTTDYVGTRIKMSRCCDAYMHTRARYVYLKDVEKVLLTQASNPMSSDGIHPTVTGYDILGNAILKSFLHGGLGEQTTWGTIPVVSNNTVFESTTALSLRYMISNGMITMQMYVNGTSGMNKIQIAKNGNTSNATPIGTFTPGAPIRGDFTSWWVKPWTNHIKLTTGSFTNCNLGLIFAPTGNIYLASGDVDSTGQAFEDYAVRLSSSDGITFISPTIPVWMI